MNKKIVKSVALTLVCGQVLTIGLGSTVAYAEVGGTITRKIEPVTTKGSEGEVQTLVTEDTTNKEVDDNNKVDKEEAKPMSELKINALAIGKSLNSDQKKETINALMGEDKEVPIEETDGKDLVKWLPSWGFTEDWDVYSSVRVQTKEKGTGVQVNLIEPVRVTMPATTYENAARTAGITDAEISVYSAKQIDGSGALAGVYKIVNEYGGNIDKERVEVAQKELNTLSEIAKDLPENTDGTKTEQLNKAQQDAKELLALKEADGDKITEKVIETAVTQALKANGLDGVLTAEQLNQIIVLLTEMNDKNIFADFTKEFDMDKVKQGVTDTFKDLKVGIEKSGFFAKIGDFISNMFKSIGNFFSNLFGKGNKEETVTSETAPTSEIAPESEVVGEQSSEPVEEVKEEKQVETKETTEMKKTEESIEVIE